MICSIAIWAYRDDMWPIEGANDGDLETARDFAVQCLKDGLLRFPADSDVPLAGFVAWANRKLHRGQ